MKILKKNQLKKYIYPKKVGLFKTVMILFLCLTSYYSMNAQDSNVSISIDWTEWASENLVELYDPAGILISTQYDVVAGYNACCNSVYTYSENLGSLVDGDDYYIVIYDLYSDGWNGTGYVSITSDGVEVLHDFGKSAISTGTVIYFDLCNGEEICDITTCCSDNLLGDSGFEETIVPSISFIAGGSINCYEGPSSNWVFDDGENAIEVVRTQDASSASEGNQFAYIPTFPTSANQFSRCYGNLMTAVSNFSCEVKTIQNGRRYVVNMDIVPFNRDYPNGGASAGLTAPRMEHQFPEYTDLYDANGNNVSLDGPYGDVAGYMPVVAWADVPNSWQTVYGVTSELSIDAYANMYFSHANDGTSGLLIDNASIRMLSFDNVGLGDVACGVSNDQITFTLNPNANIGSTPNIKYNIEEPSGFSISPSQGIYGQSTSFVLTSIADGDFTDGSPITVDITVYDEVNIGCVVIQTITVPSCIEPARLGDLVWMDDDRNGTQNGAEVGIAGIAVNLYDNGDNLVASTKTDAYGNYLFNELNPATYSVGFSLPPNYTFTNQNQGGTSIDSDVDPITGRTAAITLSSGDNNMDADAGLILTSPNTASVGNRLWLDLDENGIEGPTEIGVSFSSVTLYDASGNRISSALTDNKGYYSFNDLNPGTYQVGFTLPVSFIFTNQTSGTTDGSDVSSTTGLTNTFTLLAGEKKMDIDAGIILQDADKGSLGNSVWYDTNNNGLRETSEVGVEGAIVNLFLDGNPGQIQSTKTNSYGEFIFNNLASGNYYLEFDENSLPADYDFVSNDVGDDDLDSDVGSFNGLNTTELIVLEIAGRNMTLDAGITNMTSGAGSIGSYVWYDTNKDGIQNPDEVGIKGIPAILYDNAGNIVSETISSRDGYYLFPDLDAGIYQVEFTNLPDGYVFSKMDANLDTNDSDVDKRGHTNMIILGAGENKLDIDAGLHVGESANGTASIGDKVFYDLNNNGIQNSGELGFASITVNLLDANSSVLATLKTDTDGDFVFTGLEEGNYYIEFETSSFPTGYQLSPKNVGGTTDRMDSDADETTGMTDMIKLDTGEDMMTVDAGLYNPTTRGSIGDLVWFDSNNNGTQDLNESGVQGVMLILFDNVTNELAVTTTDKNGNYIFDNLSDGDYKIGFRNLPSGYNFASRTIGTSNGSDPDELDGMTNTITISAGTRTVDIDGGLIGNVAMLGDYVWYDLDSNGVQDANEEGISGVTVSLMDNSNTVVAKAITDALGYYKFTNLSPNTYSVSFGTLPNSVSYSTADNSGNEETDTDINPTTGLSSSIVLGSGDVNNSLDGGVSVEEKGSLGDFVWMDNVNNNGSQDASESGLSGIVAMLYDSNDSPVGISITDEKGNYLFDRVKDDSYYIKFINFPNNYVLTHKDSDTESMDSDVDRLSHKTPVYDIDGNHNNQIDAGVARLALQGFTWMDTNYDGLRSQAEIVLKNVTVNLYKSNGLFVNSTLTNEEGFYEFIEIAEDSYYLEFDEATNSNGFNIFSPTLSEMNGDGDIGDANDSDINMITRRTPIFLLGLNETIRNVDGGFYRISLPVELLSFTADFNKNCDAILKWSTATEENNSHFLVEHAIDGINFKSIAQVNGGGNSTGILDYLFVHKAGELSAGINYYRLKQVDTDGNHSYSEMLQLNTAACKDDEVSFASIYPNPTKKNARLEIISKGRYDAEYSLMDMTGKILSNQMFDIKEGTSYLDIELDGLENGIYFLNLNYGSERNETFKITKLN